MGENELPCIIERVLHASCIACLGFIVTLEFGISIWISLQLWEGRNTSGCRNLSRLARNDEPRQTHHSISIRNEQTSINCRRFLWEDFEYWDRKISLKHTIRSCQSGIVLCVWFPGTWGIWLRCFLWDTPLDSTPPSLSLVRCRQEPKVSVVMSCGVFKAHVQFMIHGTALCQCLLSLHDSKI